MIHIRHTPLLVDVYYGGVQAPTRSLITFIQSSILDFILFVCACFKVSQESSEIACYLCS